MNFKQYHPANWTVGTRISALTFVLASITIAVLLAIITFTIANILAERSTTSVGNDVRNVANTVDVLNASVNNRTRGLANVFRSAVPRHFTLETSDRIDVGGRPTPALRGDGKLLNNDFHAADLFTTDTGASATIFALDGEDFVRVSTSVKKEDGARAIGTVLDRSSVAYTALREGRSFIGLTTLFGRPAVAHYEPLQDASGKLVGALYVGVDVSEEMKQLKERIHAMTVGSTGYFFVLDAAPGKSYGNLVVHPTREGDNMLDAKDADGSLYVQRMLNEREGVIEYDWLTPGQTVARRKFTAFTYIPDWNWVVAGGTYFDEITAEVTRLRNRFIGFALLGLAVLAALLHALMRATVSRPLAQVRDVAHRIAGGDLTARVENSRSDEIGLLTEAINTIGASLSGLVAKVRNGAEQIASASQQISTGNLDLCQRTEEQASSLASTASSMEELTATVRQNAENAHQAEQLAQGASSVAEKGGTTVAQVIARMESISQSSHKIADITGVIDGIAFQTNILALNAAVEAARAGEAGRGFAVVASEVRSLAQRCASAAREIKELVETSNREVEAGNTLVHEAGTTMQDVLASVARVTAIIGEISSASQEQRGGIEQVNQAVGAMDETTQQNAALVEEASAAAQSLQDQAAQLARAVRQFRTAETPVLEYQDTGRSATPLLG